MLNNRSTPAESQAHRPRLRLTTLTFAVLAATMLWSGCAARGEGDTRRELLSEWSTQLIVPLYEQLDSRAATLQESLVALCESPNEATLQDARRRWRATRVPLKQAEVFAFGPFSRSEYEQIGPQLDSWPAKNDRVEDRVAGTALITPEGIAQAGVWVKGSPVLGYLLYSTEPDALTALQGERRCEYLQSVGAFFADRSHAIAEAWSPEAGNFAAELSGAGRTGTAFSSLRDAFGEIVNRMGFTLENIRSIKVGAALGESNGGTSQPNLLESRFSGRSIVDIQENLQGIEWLYFGDEERGFRGLDVYVKEQGASFDAEFRAGLDAINASLQAIDGSLGDALDDQRSAVEKIGTELTVLERLIQSDLIGALGLTVSFNDNDGD